MHWHLATPFTVMHVPRHEQKTSASVSLHLAASPSGTPYSAATDAAAASLAASHVVCVGGPPAVATADTFMWSGPAAVTRLCTAKYQRGSPDTSTTCLLVGALRMSSMPW